MSEEPKGAKLSNKQKVFCAEYVKCWSAAEAARRAGYSEKTAREIGYENLTKPHIKAEIALYLSEIQMSADEVLTRLT
jgi:phage terminase small subunit